MIKNKSNIQHNTTKFSKKNLEKSKSYITIPKQQMDIMIKPTNENREMNLGDYSMQVIDHRRSLSKNTDFHIEN